MAGQTLAGEEHSAGCWAEKGSPGLLYSAWSDLERPAFLGALGPVLEGASVSQPLYLPAPIMDVMSAHPSLGQGTPITGCLPVLEVPVILRSMPARPSCRHKVPFSAEAGTPPGFSGEALIPAI